MKEAKLNVIHVLLKSNPGAVLSQDIVVMEGEEVSTMEANSIITKELHILITGVVTMVSKDLTTTLVVKNQASTEELVRSVQINLPQVMVGKKLWLGTKIRDN